MKAILTFLMLLACNVLMTQKFEVTYNLVIDYDGKERLEKNYSGTWVCYDTIMYQIYGPDTLEYKVSNIVNRDVYYVNDFDETVKVLFTQNGSVMRKNMARPNQYVIYRKK
jgi:hypothetical protein